MRKKSDPFNLILLGDVTSGKATQAQYLVKKYGMYDFDMGEELTRLRKNYKKIDTICAKTIDQGKLAPTKIVREIFVRGLERIPKNQGIILDGTPKMVGEAKLIKRLFTEQNRKIPLMLYLHIPHVEILKRMMKRKGYKAGVGKRADDSLKALANRAKYYRKNIKAVVEYFANYYMFARISGLGTRTEVKNRINQSIEFYLKNYEQINQKTR